MKEKKPVNEVIEEITQNENQDINSRLPGEEGQKIRIECVMYVGYDEEMQIDIYKLEEIDERGEDPKTIYKYYAQNKDGEIELIGIRAELEQGELVWVGIPGIDDQKFTELKERIPEMEAEMEEMMQQVNSALKKDDKAVDKEQDDKADEQELNIKPEDAKQFFGEINTVKTSSQMNQEGDSLGELLDLEEYDELMFVYSDSIRGVETTDGKRADKNNSRYAVLGIRTNEDGKRVVEKIPQEKLRIYRGYNDESIRFDDDNTATRNTNTMVRFVTPNGRGLALEKSEQENKVYYQGGTSMQNTAVMGRVNDDSTGELIPVETREIFNKKRGYRNFDDIEQESERHEGDEEVEVENMDGDLKTQTCFHEITPDSTLLVDGQEVTVDQIASDSRFKCSPQEFCRIYNSLIKQNDYKDMDNILEDIETELNEQYRQTPDL